MSLIKNLLLTVLAVAHVAFASAALAATSCGRTDIGLIDTASKSATLPTDAIVGGTVMVLAALNVTLCESHPVFLHAAGNWFYQTGAPLGEMRVRVDGILQQSLTAMYFGQPGARHPFSLVAAVDLLGGRHTVELVAMRTLGTGSFVVQASTTLNALVGFGAVRQAITPDVYIAENTVVESAQMNLSPVGTVFLNHSGTVQRVNYFGDATSAIAIDGAGVPSLGINDLVPGHEEIAPISALAMVDVVGGTHRFGVKSEQLPGYKVAFNLLHGSALVAAYGGIASTNYKQVQSVDYSFSFSPTPAPDPIYFTAPVTFTLPVGHNGNVWISVNGRWLDLEANHGGGLVAAVLELDGALVGPFAVQNFESQMTQSQRNFSLTHLAKSLGAGGQHTIRVRVSKAQQGSIVDLPTFTVMPTIAVLW